MITTTENNKRILKNTIVLYIRMLFIMFLNLYISRILLKTLGIEDYGIYNVVGGVITMFSFIQGVMSAGTTRYLNFAMGRNDFIMLQKVFSVSITVYSIMCLLIIILGETFGVWFLNNQLVIPKNRLFAANLIFQFTIISTVRTFMVATYNAVIISHEKMQVFAYVSMVEVLLKLAAVYLVMISPYDKLILYGLLYMLSDIIIGVFYFIYCKVHYFECKYVYCRDKAFYREILSYSGWNLFGSLAALVKGQGLNILINIFFNPSVNAARGIAYQVNSFVNQFSSNFYTAVRPQITKYYSAGEYNNMINLVFRSSKLSFYLIMLFSIPFIIETPMIIHLWLGQIPENVVVFVRIILLISALDSMANPIMTSIHAIGKIAFYQIVGGLLILLNIPISYYYLKDGAPAVIVFVVSLVISFICIFVRIIILKKYFTEFPLLKYIKEVIINCLIVFIISILLPWFIHYKLDVSLVNAVIVCFVSIFCSIVTIYMIGLNKEEKKIVKRLMRIKYDN